jgi:ankyrin repeat protein
MSIKCMLGMHSWDGCKCTKCDKTRDELHNWNGCKCDICRNTRDEQHNWINGNCSVCKRSINSIGVTGLSHLYMAVENQSIPIIEKLISNGADVNQKTHNRDTPLCLAINNENKQIVELLLKNGADANLIGYLAHTPILKAFINTIYNSYCETSYSKSIDIFRIIAENNTDVNYEYDRFSLLHIAANYYDKEIIEILINNGADININANMGSNSITPYDIVLLKRFEIENSDITRENKNLILKKIDELIQLFKKFEAKANISINENTDMNSLNTKIELLNASFETIEVKIKVEYLKYKIIKSNQQLKGKNLTISRKYDLKSVHIRQDNGFRRFFREESWF